MMADTVLSVVDNLVQEADGEIQQIMEATPISAPTPHHHNL
jgi:hypothetical protein